MYVCMYVRMYVIMICMYVYMHVSLSHIPSLSLSQMMLVAPVDTTAIDR